MLLRLARATAMHARRTVAAATCVRAAAASDAWRLQDLLLLVLLVHMRASAGVEEVVVMVCMALTLQASSLTCARHGVCCLGPFTSIAFSGGWVAAGACWCTYCSICPCKILTPDLLWVSLSSCLLSHAMVDLHHAFHPAKPAHALV